jgi:hypothetical protein
MQYPCSIHTYTMEPKLLCKETLSLKIFFRMQGEMHCRGRGVGTVRSQPLKYAQRAVCSGKTAPEYPPSRLLAACTRKNEWFYVWHKLNCFRISPTLFHFQSGGVRRRQINANSHFEISPVCAGRNVNGVASRMSKKRPANCMY